MADPLYFSIWIKGLKTPTMMQQFEALLSVFPISALRPGVEVLTVRAISDAEPELLDEAFEEPVAVAEAMRQASQFLHEDCAYELTTHWDLWRREGNDWRLLPQEVRISCFAPEYENDVGDHMRFALGWDDQFLPDRRPVQHHAGSLQPAQCGPPCRKPARIHGGGAADALVERGGELPVPTASHDFRSQFLIHLLPEGE